MAIVNHFCFWFSVRLGSILVACFTMIQAISWLSLCIYLLQNIEDTKSQINYYVESLSVTEGLAKDIADDPETYLKLSISFYVFLSASCVLVFIGAYKLWVSLVYPFAILYFLYLLYLLTLHIFVMLSFKKNEYGIGTLILFSNIGGFVLLYFLYQWFCIISFLQIMNGLRSDLAKRKLMEEHQAKKLNLVSNKKRDFYKY